MGNSVTTKQDTGKCLPKPQEPLLPNDIELIKESWEQVGNLEELGINVMIRIFQAHSQIKSKWIFAANMDTEAEMLSNSQLRYHARKIMDTLNGVIQRLASMPLQLQGVNLDDMVKLGESHYNYGVTAEDFVHFEESLLFALRKQLASKKLLTPKCVKAWKKLFWLIASKLTEGIDIETERAKKRQE